MNCIPRARSSRIAPAAVGRPRLALEPTVHSRPVPAGLLSLVNTAWRHEERIGIDRADAVCGRGVVAALVLVLLICGLSRRSLRWISRVRHRAFRLDRWRRR
jgi:hypothetical protein